MRENRRMPLQSFSRFMVRRVWCTTLFFVALLIAFFTATSVYYVVRINMIEKHLNARALQADGADDAAGGGNTHHGYPTTDAPSPYGEAGIRRHQFMSRATPAGHSELPGRLRRSTAPRYTDAYKVLTVGTPVSRQAVRNPALPDAIPLWEAAEAARGGDDENINVNNNTGARHRVPSRQRYALRGLEAGRQYMLRLSFLGSPSVAFEVLLYQVPRRHLDAALNGVQGWVASPQDTELRVFATSTTNALLFDYEEEVWLDGDDADDEGDDDDEGADVDDGMAHFNGQRATAQRFVPVVEVRSRALSIPIDATRVPVVRFNLILEPLSSSFLPQVAVPLITYSAWVVVFFGYLVVYTFVSIGIAGGRPHAD